MSTQDPYAYPGQPPRSWWSRNWKWVVPVGCLLPLLVCCGGPVGFFLVMMRGIKESWAYKEGIELARHNKAVVAKLGEPIEATWAFGGSFQIQNGTEKTDAAIPLTGPKGTGMLHVTAVRQNGQWKFEIAEFTVPGEMTKINLLADGEKKGEVRPPAGEAPKD